MFNFINSKDWDKYTSFSNNYLELDNVVVRNFFYPMNSMLKTQRYGANILINDSQFSEINICGSIIKNKFVHKPLPDLKHISDEYLEPSTKDLMKVIHTYQKQLHSWHHLYFYDNPAEHHINDNNQIKVVNSIFKNLNYHSKVNS